MKKENNDGNIAYHDIHEKTKTKMILPNSKIDHKCARNKSPPKNKAKRIY